MSSELRFDNKVVVVTGAGGGLGKQYATFFASRGASVVVNDLGGSLKGDDSNSRVADKVVEEIRANGGKAVANYDNVENGDKIVETAVKNFGTVHIVINNAGILRDVSFKNMKDQDWDLIYNVHLYGSYKVAKAAWPYMRKQKFGKIINTASAAGLYGNFGQTNYSAAKLALVGFTETLAKEGAKYNITANAITPLAASRMTETIMPQDILDKLKPEYVVPVVAYLVHEDTTETWGIYEVGAGAVTKVRWERAAGALLKPDDSLTPSALLKQWEQVNNFEGCTHPDGPNDFLSLAEKVQSMPSNEQGETISYKDQVIIVTGAGAGLGRAYALLLGKLGAKVVVNDFADPQPVVDEIKKAGGTAVGDKSNVVEGHKVVQTAVDNFGTVHGVINNAGILRDKSFQNISEDEWNAVIAVHLKGTYAVTKAAWPYFLKQKYGRVVNTTSTSGIYGNFGQSNYAAAKLGILGFSRALALEGKKYNIFVNTIAPNAGTNMTKGVFTEEMLEMFKPEFVAPTPVLLCSDKAPTTGDLFEVGMGWVGRTRWQRTGGVAWGSKNPITAEKVAAKWDQIINFDDGRATNPASTQESSMGIFELSTNAEEQEEEEGSGSGEEGEVGIYSYDHKQIILYNLGVGAKATDLPYVYENNENFGPVPTFGVLPYFTVPLDYSNVVKNYNPMKLLHGEQYLEICKWPIPQSATIETKQEILDVVDKGKAAVVIAAFHSYDKETGEKLFYNVGSFFLRGSGGFGGPAKAKDRGAITAANKPPQRKPDFQTEYHISEDLAALYRLSGDFNPLHIDPDFAAVGNFPKPILHGLCTLGISARLLVDKYGVFKNVKVRFSGHVFPGETLQIAAWKEGNKVIFESYVKERQTTAISAAALEYSSNGNAKL